ncbi:zinc-dependent alcohol dehydrogenase [Cytobacillus purgationiresistens]|uniref:L-iditol 2-dehydrogenase n=1 Tax=Cytobacillus purgationiresistens TaxID=863449 RepID=A0ABU0AKV1_9BACI|nr:zinc-binding dehydrogenase [Cytobacillus purgationiresistens]MDQ0271008.1 L-iditol 2-dehydrogenase [Cytobacillus purgationiresistens]
MKTLVITPEGELEVIEVEKPTINAKQALVKTVSSGICGTDATIIKKSFKGVDDSSYPLMLGHEGVGEVIEIGAEVKSYQVGDIVVLSFAPEVMSGSQKIHSVWGSFSEYGVVEDIIAYEAEEVPEVAYAQAVLPPFIKKEEAPVIVTLREVLSTILYFNIKPLDSVVVYGSGPVATTFVKLLRLLGVQDIVAVVRSEAKQKLLLEYGASKAINSSTEDVKKEVYKQFSEGVSYVLDAVGSEEVINEAMALLKDRGEILCYGVPKVNKMVLDWSSSAYNWKLNFQQMPSKKEEGECHNQIISWIKEGKLSLESFISDYYSFNDITAAFKDYLEGKTMKKVIITYN